MTLTSRYGEELSISLRQSSSFCRVACPRRPATRPSTVRTCPVMPSAYRGVIGARFGRLQMGCTGARRGGCAWSCGVRADAVTFDGMAENRASAVRSGIREGVPCWVDAQLPDVEAGKRFYGELFGWTFEDAAGRHRPFADALQRRRAGRRARPPRRTAGMPTVGRLLRHRRHPRRRRRPDPGGRRPGRHRARAGAELGTASLAQRPTPEGAVFGLWQAGEPRGLRKRHEPGTFAWAEVYARDTERADAFYGGSSASTARDLDSGRTPGTPSFRPGPRRDRARRGHRVGGRGRHRRVPARCRHFLVHFAVADCEAALGTADRLGGRIQAPPFETPYGQDGRRHRQPGGGVRRRCEPIGAATERWRLRRCPEGMSDTTPDPPPGSQPAPRPGRIRVRTAMAVRW